VFDSQGTFSVDENFTYSASNPISGGTYEDLIWLKTIDQTGHETGTAIGRNPNFHNTSARYAPASGRIGVRLTF
jgi:hypothetical protein